MESSSSPYPPSVGLLPNKDSDSILRASRVPGLLKEIVHRAADI